MEYNYLFPSQHHRAYLQGHQTLVPLFQHICMFISPFRHYYYIQYAEFFYFFNGCIIIFLRTKKHIPRFCGMCKLLNQGFPVLH